MGYELSLKLKDFDKFKVENFDKSIVNHARLDIICYCLSEKEFFSYFDLKKKLEFYKLLLQKELQFSYTKEFNDTQIIYMGKGMDFVDIEEETDKVLDDLYIYSNAIKKPDFFEEEDKWIDLLSKIRSVMDLFKDKVIQDLNNTIIEEYRDCWIESD